MKTSRPDIKPYITKDGSIIRELMHPDIDGSRKQSLAEAEIKPGESTALHRHIVTEEIYHVTQGQGMMTLGEEHFSVCAGDTVCIHPGVAHKVVNSGRETLLILCCCAPPYSHSDTEII